MEAYAKYHETHHLPRPTVMLSIAMIILGVLHPRIAAWGIKQRRLLVTPEHISIPKRPFSRVTLPWADVQSIDVDAGYATVTAVGERTHRFDLNDMVYADAVRDAFIQAKTFLDESRHAADASIESTSASA